MRLLGASRRRRDANGGEPRRSRAWQELEAVPIVRQLTTTEGITGDQVDVIWTTWFGETLSGRTDQTRFEAFVARLNALSPRPAEPT